MRLNRPPEKSTEPRRSKLRNAGHALYRTGRAAKPRFKMLAASLLIVDPLRIVKPSAAFRPTYLRSRTSGLRCGAFSGSQSDWLCEGFGDYFVQHQTKNPPPCGSG